MARLFGTDGIRGIANEDLTCELAFKIGQSGASVLSNQNQKPTILIGRDTRISGNMFEDVISAGICSVGGQAIRVGVIPTPGLAYLVRTTGADAGVMISASHNSFEFNGIKWFNRDGFKLSDEIENQIESLVLGNITLNELPKDEHIGTSENCFDLVEKYIDYLYAQCKQPLNHLKVVVDCANGAAAKIAPVLFERLGANATFIAIEPNGRNINHQCGSTHLELLQDTVCQVQADIGIAFDGDADRMIAVDHLGNVIDGDRIMAVCAVDMAQKGILKQNTLVATVMSNLGMKLFLENKGIEVVTTNVGDRYVLEHMLAHDCNFGGEQSGHFVFLDKNTTGDGIMSSLELLSLLQQEDKSLAEMVSLVEILPQILINVRVNKQAMQEYMENESFQEVLREVTTALGEKGRVLIRPSGTEPLIRVMIEGHDLEQIRDYAMQFAHVFERDYDGMIQL